MSSSMDVTEEFKKLDACIHCGMCLPTCPTYRVTGSEAESPRGRLYLMREFNEGRLTDPNQLAAHLDPCLGCLGCVTACPSGVQYGDLLLTSRHALLPHQNKLRHFIRRFSLRYILPNRLLLTGTALLLRSFPDHFKKYLPKALAFAPTPQPVEPIASGQTFGKNTKGRVALFTGCVMNAAYSQTHRATINVLVRNGYEVVVPPQTCCGALAHHSGETDILNDLAQQNVASILAMNPDWIVVNAAGCGSTLKEYDAILNQYAQKTAFSPKVQDVMELLAQHPLEGPLQPVDLTATYHAACHLYHAQQVKDAPFTVLSQIPELKLIPLREAEMCCGSAGVYNLAHPDLSQAILSEKMAAIAKTKADVVLAANPGCVIQLETGLRQSGLPMTVAHPIDIVAMAYPE